MHIGKKTRIIISLCLILLLAGFSAGAFAYANAHKPNEASLRAAPFEQIYIDRLNLQVDATQFVFMQQENGRYAVRFTFTAEKTEPDFYAVIDNFTITGLPYSEMTIRAASENGNQIMIPGAELPSDYDGSTRPLQWEAEIIIETDEPVTYTPTLILTYTSGTKYELTETCRHEIDMIVKVCDISPLPQLMEDAEAYFTLGIYTDASLAMLRDKLDEIELALRSVENFNDTQIEIWVQDIVDCINALIPM